MRIADHVRQSGVDRCQVDYVPLSFSSVTLGYPSHRCCLSDEERERESALGISACRHTRAFSFSFSFSFSFFPTYHFSTNDGRGFVAQLRTKASMESFEIGTLSCMNNKPYLVIVIHDLSPQTTSLSLSRGLRPCPQDRQGKRRRGQAVEMQSRWCRWSNNLILPVHRGRPTKQDLEQPYTEALLHKVTKASYPLAGRESKHIFQHHQRLFLAHVTAASMVPVVLPVSLATPAALHPNGGQVASSTMRLLVQSAL